MNRAFAESRGRQQRSTVSGTQEYANAKHMVRKFLSALVQDTVGVLSTAGSIILLAVSMWYWDKPVPRWLTLAVAVASFAFAAGRAWIREHTGKIEAEGMIYQGRPTLSIYPLCHDRTSGFYFWAPFHHVFQIENLGERAARHIRFSPVTCGNLSLEFAEFASLRAHSEPRSLPIILRIKDWPDWPDSDTQSDPLKLKHFLEQMSKERGDAKQFSITIRARCYDLNDAEVEQSWILYCELPDMVLSIAPLIRSSG